MATTKQGVEVFELGFNAYESLINSIQKAREDGKIDASDLGVLFSFLVEDLLPLIQNINKLDDQWNDLDFDEVVADIASQFEQKVTDDQGSLMLFTAAILAARGIQLSFFNDAKETEVGNEEE